jgi:hypothetical protein
MTVTGPPSDGHRVDQQPWAALLDEGMVTLPEALASVDEATRASGDRVLILRVAGGLSLDVLLDRGLDIGAAWWNGIPLAWRSPNLVDPGPGRRGHRFPCTGEPSGRPGRHSIHRQGTRWPALLPHASPLTAARPSGSLGGGYQATVTREQAVKAVAR